MISRPFVLNRDLVDRGCFLRVTAALAPSHWGGDGEYPMRSAIVAPDWESLTNWVFWVVGMCVHGDDRHIGSIRWLFEINGHKLDFKTVAGTEDNDYPSLPLAITNTILVDEDFPDYRTTGPLTPEDELSCRAWTRHDDDDEPALHQTFYLDWIKVVPTVYDGSGGFAQLFTWYDAFGGNN